MSSAVIKRVFDASVAGAILVVSALPMLIIAALIRIMMGSPVLFRQVRPGKDKKLFSLYKFRTMTDDRDEDGRPLADGRRLTRLGRFLRRTSLDELPQCWNVLKGEMSLVGPRPLLARYLPHYSERECLRFTVTPGITGWAQIHGRNGLEWDERLARDIWYVEHWSLALDFRILLLTVGVVLRRTGVMADVYAGGGLDLDEERTTQRKPARNVQDSPC
ncbi:MAG: sugar transferase [Planctomycetes bacterium]|nr:sugar transferase [Planctomycetota bacterium]